jgi:hypothetical protein
MKIGTIINPFVKIIFLLIVSLVADRSESQNLAKAKNYNIQADTSVIRVSLLGTGTPKPSMERFGPSILVQAGSETLLFDAGRGCLQRIVQLNLSYKKIDALLADLGSDTISGKIIFTGNGAMLHQELIMNTFGNRQIQNIPQETATAMAIALLALEHYQQDNIACYRVEPNYVKSQYFAIQRPFNVPRI